MRILVVEDDPRLLRNLAKVFREEGYAVDTAEAGDEGLYKAESYSYDAIILDVMLPRLDGWDPPAEHSESGVAPLRQAQGLELVETADASHRCSKALRVSHSRGSTM